MTFRKTAISAIASALFLLIALTACSSRKSYAELLTSETKSVNFFLANQLVVNEIPADSVFETGPGAPYYRIDPEGNIYMQVIEQGDPEKVKTDDVVYFSYLRYDLNSYAKNNTMPEPSGNANDMEYEVTWFRFNNYQLQASSQYGSGIQAPLKFLGYNSRVNIVIKSQFGFTSEISYVVPFLYDVRYFKGQI